MELINYTINQRLIVYKIKIRWNRTEKLIIDPTLDLIKDLMFSH